MRSLKLSVDPLTKNLRQLSLNSLVSLFPQLAFFQIDLVGCCCLFFSLDLKLGLGPEL
jgi:hypothetical protein